jgi:hypothetical protein
MLKVRFIIRFPFGITTAESFNQEGPADEKDPRYERAAEHGVGPGAGTN